jgi:hypothetical protein
VGRAKKDRLSFLSAASPSQVIKSSSTSAPLVISSPECQTIKPATTSDAIRLGLTVRSLPAIALRRVQEQRPLGHGRRLHRSLRTGP